MKNMFKILQNKKIARDVYELLLQGDTSKIDEAGSFVNIKIDGFQLRRPISVCDLNGDKLTLVYKVFGKGTEALSKMQEGELDLLTGLGNGYKTGLSGNNPLLIGGGVGVPPLYYLARLLIKEGKNPGVILGFNALDEIFYEKEFQALGCKTVVTTVDGSYGIKGFVTDALGEFDYSYVYTCGPGPMLRAVYDKTVTGGQYSFEERMGCGFGVCMGCSVKTKNGFKRICADGPVLVKEEIIW